MAMRPPSWRRSVTLLVSLLFGLATSQIQNADYSGKVNVRVNQVLTNRPRIDSKVTGWSPHSQEYAKVNVNINGQQIDRAIFHTLKPTATQRDTRRLLRYLGNNLDPVFMSVDKPSYDKANLPPPIKDANVIRMAKKVKFNFTDHAGASLRVDEQHEYMFRNWLIEQATCPVQYFWEDLGYLFFPRWVRRGRCLPTHRCSWPPGMQCRVSHSRSMKLLQWQCFVDKKKEQRKNKRHLQLHDEPVGQKKNGHLRRWKKKKKRRGKRRGSRGPRRTYMELRERRKKFRWRRRLIRKLSMSRSGYLCKWQKTDYVVYDQCKCGCH